MIRSLFARLTGDPRRGRALVEAAIAEARAPHWFVEGEVPDTLEGRFAVLATVAALMIVRLEREGAKGEAASVALTERFVETLDTEIREMGVGDPALGKQVRRLVGALAGRVERWRSVVESGQGWTDEVERSLYGDEALARQPVRHSEAALQQLWQRLAASSLEALVSGRI
jgi:cytochrome b pre-mRNA-processing protein 3